jgi:LmbE family N-acetylglucosaminyl deacetylase
VLEDRDVRSVLVVTAHPDDVDFGAAGSVARWTSEGVEVAYCIVTNGEAGGFDDRATRDEVPAMRQAEQRAAAAVVGVTDVTFLGHPDGRLAASIELRRDIAGVIRRVRPQRVLCQSPQRLWGRIFASHPDHLATGEATLDAVYPDARNPFAHMELLEVDGLEPHTVKEVWLMGGGGITPDQVIDVTDTADRKLAALRCHRSQYDNWNALEERVRGWLRATAEAGGLPDGHLAEMFQVIQTG